MNKNYYFKILVLLILIVPKSNGILRRCFQCRSRGDLGSCKDPFKYNTTAITMEPGISAIPCASGWCGKVIEGADGSDDFDQATQRMCVQRGPSDSEDRCANTIYNHKKVFMCFCQGDLCNGAPQISTRSLYKYFLLPIILRLIVQ
uniref:CSON001034 protein n=1 Tax=Culicoides sonorensis TaxID=179676 RepID=A0A336LRB1_CULSO